MILQLYSYFIICFYSVTFYLTCADILSGILSDKYSDICSGILSKALTFSLAFYLTFRLTLYLTVSLSGIVSRTAPDLAGGEKVGKRLRDWGTPSFLYHPNVRILA